MDKNSNKAPRLYIDHSLHGQDVIELCKDHTHYLKNVLRQQVGAHLRIFNGKDGEFLAYIVEIQKKSCRIKLQRKLKDQPECKNNIHLYFAPMKKYRMEFLIEKAVELGVHGLHPVITTRTETRKLNAGRIHKQIIEASEQCERLDIPVFHDFIRLHELPKDRDVMWCAERENARGLQDVKRGDWNFLVGPEGGFDGEEVSFLRNSKKIIPISLGSRILRAETAALTCLAHASIQSIP